ncbi:CTP-dependent riboflavin kinase [Candidatus Woesearchaeota archaeon]|nr:CTP-dependent riboflavin kinase [Candidatus Woesearchaeota archaeon]
MGAAEVVTGIVVSGLGEGAFFMSIDHYRKEIEKKLGFGAYPGTLNIKVKKIYIDLLKNVECARISGFKSGNKSFGGAACYAASINGVKGAIIMPDLTKHKNVIEFIAPVHLRSALKIKDGNEVELELK